MEKTKVISRGDIFMCDFGSNEGSVQNGIRPVIVLQDDAFNKHSPTIIVAPITTVLKKGYLPSHVYLGKKFGLSRTSMVLLEQIRTINKTELQKYIGTVTDERVLNLLWKSVKQTMGFWNSRKTNNMTTLCPVCLEKCKKSGKYFVSRVNYSTREKEVCDSCKEEYGYNYYLKPKRN